MRFTYLKTPLNKYTFKSKTIKSWVEANVEGIVLNLFAGKTALKCNEIRNDIDEEMNAHFHYDALLFLNIMHQKNYKFNTVLLDPPYSYRKSMEMYHGKVMSPFNALKDVILNVLFKHGIVITFGYQSVSMGKTRNFTQEHLLVMSHGGAIHDTLAIVERWGNGKS